MFEAIFKSLEETFVKLDLRRFVFWVFFLILLILGLWIFELYTNYGFYHRMDEYLDELTKLQKIEDNGISKSDELKPLYEKAVTDLSKQQMSVFQLRFNAHLLIEIFSACWVWMVLLIWGILQRLGGDKSSTGLVVGSLILLILFGFLAILIQLPCSWWLESLLFNAVQFVIVFFLAWWGNRKKT